METQEFFTPEMISGMIGGAMVAVALLFARGVAWLKALVMTTPTKIDDKAYNALVKAFTDAGVISEQQAAAASVDKPKAGGLKLQCALPAVLVAGLLALSLPGCTAGDLATARQLTIVDGALFVAENHARRQAVRQQLYNFEDEVIAGCKDWARAAKFDEDMAKAQERIKVCLDFIFDAYPNLATIEMLEEGADSLNDLRARFRGEPEPAPVIIGGGGPAAGGAN